MAKIATAVFSGLSGIKYSFNVYPIGTDFKAVGAVYYFTKRTINSQNLGEHDIIYVGITNDLSTRFEDHHKKSCYERQNANCICIHQEEKEKERMKIEEDLIKKHKPHCNDIHK